MQHVAIDLHDEYSQICVMNEQRELLAEIKVPTRRGALRDFFRQREREQRRRVQLHGEFGVR